MKYKCLILDHDDTSVRSTSEIHHPAHVETMRQMRPGSSVVDIDTWFLKNFNPGIIEFLTGELGFTEEEMDEEYRIWREYNIDSNPMFFDGILDLIADFKKGGGIVAVVSHSEADIIRRHYEVNGDGVMPDIIFGWDYDESKRKPSVWPIEQIKLKFGIDESGMLMVDDLKPGLTMAKNASVKIAGAGWGHSVPEIESYMRANCDYYFKNVAELAAHLSGS